ncbi:MAG: AIR synthase family protein [Candidatus Metalachnospira sp.]|nr:AIR synthase family protein [Candidatus Metalachnospira sp.]
MNTELQTGKVPVEILNRIVLEPINNNKFKRKDIIVRPTTGEDCSAVDLEGEICVLSTDPITASGSNAGYLVVHINCNDAASAGAEPIGMLLTALLPEHSTEGDLRDIINGAYSAASELGIEILGGHTEITSAVNRPVVSGTVVAKTRNRQFISSGGAKVGQDIIMTKWAAIEGTSIIANDYYNKFANSVSSKILDEAKSLSSMISVVKEGIIAADFGATAMHDATEGGILGAVWEVAECSDVGVEIFSDDIPVLECTKILSKIAGVDYLRLISSGTMIITSFDGQNLVKRLKENGINSSVIGKITEGGKFITYSGHRIELLPQEKDEIYSVFVKD